MDGFEFEVCGQRQTSRLQTYHVRVSFGMEAFVEVACTDKARAIDIVREHFQNPMKPMRYEDYQYDCRGVGFEIIPESEVP